MAALEAIAAGSVRMNAPATSGAIVPPSEFRACASVRRTGALCSGPRIATYGLAAVCSAVTPAPTTNTAVRNSGKLTSLAAGTNSRQPTT